MLNENGELGDFDDEKVIEIPVSRRPTYQDFFELVNRNTGDNDINIIANTDIYLENDIEILNYLDLKRKCFALTRWDVDNDGNVKLFFMEDSQDTWIFKGKIPKIKSDFQIGIPGCDARIAHEIFRAGVKISNPSFSIKTYHLHLSDFRTHEQTWTKRILPPYKELSHVNINNWFKNLFDYFFCKKNSANIFLIGENIKEYFLKVLIH